MEYYNMPYETSFIDNLNFLDNFISKEISFDNFLDHAKSKAKHFEDFVYRKHFKKELLNLYTLLNLGNNTNLKKSDIDQFEKCLLDIDYSLLTFDLNNPYYKFLPGDLYSVDFLKNLILKSEGKIIPSIFFDIKSFNSEEEMYDLLKFIIDNKNSIDKIYCNINFSYGFHVSKYSKELFELNQENILLGINQKDITNDMLSKCNEEILIKMKFLPDNAYRDGKILYKMLNLQKKHIFLNNFFQLEKYIPGTLKAPQILTLINKFDMLYGKDFSNLFFGLSKKFIKKCINLRPELVLCLNYDWLYNEGYFIYICHKLSSKKMISYHFLTSYYLKAPENIRNNKNIQKFMLRHVGYSIITLNLEELLKDEENIEALLNNKTVNFQKIHPAFISIVCDGKKIFKMFPETLLKICKILIKEDVFFYKDIKNILIDCGVYSSIEEFILNIYKENVKIIRFKEVFDTLKSNQKVEIFAKEPSLLKKYSNSFFANDAKNIYNLISSNAKTLSFIKPENISEWHIIKAYNYDNAKYLYNFIKKYQFKLNKLKLNILEIYEETRDALFLDFLSEDELLILILKDLIYVDMHYKRNVKKKISKIKMEFI